MIKIRLPDFIIGGAARSGTTWLYELLYCCPQIYMARPVKPEPKFFLVDENYNKGISHYAKLFSDASDNQLVGEKSTNYLESSLAAERIKKHLPSIKLIFILREPVERAYSNYLWSCMNGLEAEDFATALSLEIKRERELTNSLRFARPNAYFSRGLYAQMLTPYFRLFSREQILCLRYEDIVQRVEVLVSKVNQFLQIKLFPEDAIKIGVINPTPKNPTSLSSEIREMLAEAYVGPNQNLASLLGPEFNVWNYISK